MSFKKPIQATAKKIMLTSLTASILSGYLVPAKVFAEENSSITESLDSSEPSDTNKDSAVENSEIIVEESTAEAEVVEQEETVSTEEKETSKDDTAPVSDEEVVESEQKQTENSTNTKSAKTKAAEETISAETVQLDLDFTSYEEVNSAFTNFLNEFSELSEAERLGYIKEFRLVPLDGETLYTSLEILDLTQYSKEKLEQLTTFMQKHSDEVNKVYDAESSILAQEQADIEESFSAFSDLVTTSSSNTNDVFRMSGATRFQTAVDISKSGWNNSPTVVIANSHNFADALAGVPLATMTNSPILLVPSHAVPKATLAEIKRLGSIRAIILGGEFAVSKNVENTLKKEGLSVKRYAGANRYATAESIAKEVTRRSGSKEAFLASGEDFADAMSVAAIAGRRGAPIYLTRSYTLSGQARKAAQKIPNWTVVGGENALNKNVYNVLGSQGAKNRIRLYGNTRYETNIAVLNHFGIDTHKAYVATGNDFVDALTGSVLAGVRNSGVMLVKDSDEVLIEALNYGDSKDINSYTLFGGVDVLSSRLAEIFKYNRLSGKKPLVVIDPGHGDRYIGAAYNGIAEKTINLKSSKFLRDYLIASGDYDVRMTRDKDMNFASNLSDDLGYRSKFANELNADIFISIHYNAGTPGSNGLETFVHYPSYPQQAPRSRLQIGDWRIKESRDLADSIQNLIVSRTGLYNRGVKGLDLNVLRKTEMPAVLVELGFMASAIDRKVIYSDSYRQTTARAIKDGVDEYFGF